MHPFDRSSLACERSTSFSTDRSSISSTASSGTSEASSANSTPSHSPAAKSSTVDEFPFLPRPASSPLSRTQPQRVSALATFFCDSLVWLWFAPRASSSAKGKGVFRDIQPSRDQLFPTERFLRFCHGVLSTTQVSHSVCILALLFVHRLKSRNDILGSRDSEYRMSVCALMLANKTLDDNTYTAKTWADVSGLELRPLLVAEHEFLVALEHRLHVTESEFRGWVRLLEGHVATRKSQIVTSRQARAPSTRRATQPPSASTRDQDLFGLGLGEGFTFGGSIDRDLAYRPTVQRTNRATLRVTPSFSSFSFPPTPTSNPAKHAVIPTHSSSIPQPPTYSPLSHSSTVASTSGRRPVGLFAHTRSASDIHSAPLYSPPRSAKRGAEAELAPSAKRLRAAYVERSLSTGAAPAPRQAIYASTPTPKYPTHLDHQVPRADSARNVAAPRPTPSDSHFHYLADHHFLPRQNSLPAPPDSLCFYALAAGQKQAVQRTTAAHWPQQPHSFAAQHPHPTLQHGTTHPARTVSSTTSVYTTKSFVWSDYANAGPPGVNYGLHRA